jgi:hypothetical protein
VRWPPAWELENCSSVVVNCCCQKPVAEARTYRVDMISATDSEERSCFVKQPVSSETSFTSSATSQRRQVLDDVYYYEINYSFISSNTFADSLQVFEASTLNLITFITPL